MVETKIEETIYQRLADAELQNHMLSDRLEMMTRIATSYMNERVEICRQLEQFDLVLTIKNEVIQKAVV